MNPYTSTLQAARESQRAIYGFGANCARLHPEDARSLATATVCGMDVYVDAEMVPGEPEIVSPEEARRRYLGQYRKTLAAMRPAPRASPVSAASPLTES